MSVVQLIDPRADEASGYLYDTACAKIRDTMGPEAVIKHMFKSRTDGERRYIISIVRDRSTEYSVVCYDFVD